MASQLSPHIKLPPTTCTYMYIQVYAQNACLSFSQLDECCPLYNIVQSDLGKLSRIHFKAMLRLLQEGIIQSSPPSSSQTQAAAQITQGQKQSPSSVHPTKPASTASRSQPTAVSSSQSQASSSLPPSSLSHSAQYPTSSSPPPPPLPGASSRSTPLYHTAGTAHVPTYPSSSHPQHSLSQPLPPPPPAPSGGTTYHRSYAAVAGTSVAPVASTEQAPAVTSATGGQFYSRRTGAYNY